MYCNVFAAEKLAAFQRDQLVQDVERRRVLAASPQPAGHAALNSRLVRPTMRERLYGLVPRFGWMHLRPA